MINQEFIQELFSNLETGNSGTFFDQVSDNVHWTVMGTHPLAGVYNSKADFLKATFERLNGVLNEGVVLTVENVIASGDTAVVEMRSLSTAKNGEPFNNTYCWIVKFDDNKIITDVTAYVDSALVQKVIDDNE